MDIDLHETQNIIDAAKEQVYLQGKTHMGNRAKPRRGQVFSCHLGVGVGSEFQKRRPCVVLSNEINNINSAVIIVAPITHTQKNIPICVPIADKFGADGSVILDGCANLAGLRAVSSYRLVGFVCVLDNDEMKRIDVAIAKHLGIVRHYNTLLKVVEDDKRHIVALNNVLGELRVIRVRKTTVSLLRRSKSCWAKM
jgi:mRNA interferase MazF